MSDKGVKGPLSDAPASAEEAGSVGLGDFTSAWLPSRLRPPAGPLRGRTVAQGEAGRSPLSSQPLGHLLGLPGSLILFESLKQSVWVTSCVLGTPGTLGA